MLAKKAMKEVECIQDATKEKPDEESNESLDKVFYKDTCLTDLGGDTAEEKLKRIARRLWTKSELSKIVIDPQNLWNQKQRVVIEPTRIERLHSKKRLKLFLGVSIHKSCINAVCA